MRLYNTLTRKKDELNPPESGINLFVCGPTVYDYIHIGNARTFTLFDALVKYLRQKLGIKINYLQNITDIDDKIIARARAGGEDAAAFARKFEGIFMEDAAALGIDSVGTYARASEHIPEIVGQVKVLIKKGHAYLIKDDGYYFDLKTFPDYGRLSGRTVAMAEDGVSRIDESPRKRNRGDFNLWKLSQPGEPAWDTELGRGRPLPEILESMRMVAEGIQTTAATVQLARQKGVEMPITEQMYALLYHGLPPQEVLRKLLDRNLKAE